MREHMGVCQEPAAPRDPSQQWPTQYLFPLVSVDNTDEAGSASTEGPWGSGLHPQIVRVTSPLV